MAVNGNLAMGDIAGFRPEMSNILLLRVHQSTIRMNSIRKELNNILGTFTHRNDVLPEYTMDRMFRYFLSTYRWSQIIQLIFHNMEPPIQKNPDNNGYSYHFIEERRMNQQQKMRAAELGHSLAGAVWYHLVNSERVFLFGSIHGMNAYLGHILHYLKLYTVQQEVEDESEEQSLSPRPVKRARKQ